MSDFVEIVQNVGFPIAAFVLMWYQSNTTIKDCTEAINALRDVLTAHFGGVDINK